jgi:hypothetical protein
MGRGTWTSRRVVSLAALAVLAGCSTGSTITKSTADAAAVVPGCPVTLAEAQAAIPGVVSGPDVNPPYKVIVQQCGFSFAELDRTGNTAGVSISVVDAEGQGVHLWDSVRTDPSFPNATDVAGVGDTAFVTGTPVFDMFWAVQGQIGLKIGTLRSGGLTKEQFAALAKAAYARLKP